jgi:TM2 domain-containing membrane protein YozV
LVLTNNVILLFYLLVAPILMGVARIYLTYFYVGILIIVLWLTGCPVCEVLVCIVRGTGSGMLHEHAYNNLATHQGLYNTTSPGLQLLRSAPHPPPGSPTTDVFTPKTSNFKQQNTPATITATPLLAHNLIQKYVSC